MLYSHKEIYSFVKQRKKEIFSENVSQSLTDCLKSRTINSCPLLVIYFVLYHIFISKGSLLLNPSQGRFCRSQNRNQVVEDCTQLSLKHYDELVRND